MLAQKLWEFAADKGRNILKARKLPNLEAAAAASTTTTAAFEGEGGNESPLFSITFWVVGKPPNVVFRYLTVGRLKEQHQT